MDIFDRSARVRLVGGTASVLLMLGAAAPALAAEGAAPADAAASADTLGDNDIIVTAQKRGESLQTVPIAISAYGEEALERSNVDSVNQLQRLAPSLYFGRQDGQALISVRGIGSNILAPGADGGVSVHIDGVYLSKAQMQDAAIFDLERVEVLRGPQGTVNGRNATGGAINLISNRPTDDFTGDMTVTVGNYGAVKTTGAFGGPLGSDKLLWRVAFRTDNHDGYTPNLAGGRPLDEANQQSVRGSLLWRPNDRLEVLLTADYDRVKTNGIATLIQRTATGAPLPAIALGGVPATGRAVSAEANTFYRREIYGFTSRTTMDFGGVTLTSIGSYRKLNDRVMMDLDGTTFPLLVSDLFLPQRQMSQELTLTSNGDGPFTWLAGLYFFDEKQKPDQGFVRPNVSRLTVGGTAKTRSYAAYVQGTYDLTDALRVTIGGRYTRDRKKADEFLRFDPFNVLLTDTLKNSWGAFTPKFSIDYQFTPDVMAYATISRGFRSGGINVGNLQGSTFDPEYVWNYELGFKGQFLDRRLQTNLALFHNDYTNLQLFKTGQQTGIVENAAKATIDGVELEVVARPTDGLRLDVAASYLDAKIKEFDTVVPWEVPLGVQSQAGNTLPRAPKWKLNMGLENRWAIGDGGFTLRGEYAYTSKVWFNEYNRPSTSQPATSIWNARATYETPNGKYRITAFVENLTDKYYISNMTVGSAGTGFIILEYAAPPRTYGVQLSASF